MNEENYADFLDFFRRGPYVPFLREHRSAGASAVNLLTLSQPAGHYPDPATPEWKLQLVTRGTFRGRMDVGAGVFRGPWEPGDIAFTPPDAAADYLLDGGFDLLVAVVPSAALRGFDGNGSGAPDYGPLHASPFRDATVEALCRALWAEAAAGNPHGSLFADGAVLALAAALARLANRPSSGGGRPAGFGPARLRRALDLIEDWLGDDLSLSDLAGAAALSPRQVLRAFRAATGLSPHAYLQERRVERAKALLAATELPLADVALSCGFKGQSHFGQAFRRMAGASPGAYRRQRRG